MSETFQTVTSPPGSERRTHPRQHVLFSSILLDADNGGILLNISERGFAMQAVHNMADDQLPPVRFQFSLSESWIETQGRIAWLSASKKTAGVEFIDLPDEAIVQIRQWIASITPPSPPPEEGALVDQIELVKCLPITVEPPSPLPVSELPVTSSTVPNLNPTEDSVNNDPVQDLANVDRTREVEAIPQQSKAMRVGADVGGNTRPKKGPPLYLSYDETRYDRETSDQTAASRRSRERIALLLATLVFLSACAFLGIRFRKTGDGPQGGEARAAAKAPESSSNGSGNAGDLAVNPSPLLDRPGYVLQVGAMAHEKNADVLAESLRQKKFPVVVTRSEESRLYRVLVGPYRDIDSTLKVKAELERQGVQALRMPWNPSAH